MSATIEEVISDHSDHGIQSRSERKARKALLGLGLKKISGITRVTLRRPKNVRRMILVDAYVVMKFEQFLFVIASPDVYKSPNSDTYIVFGEAKMEDMNAQAQLSAAQQLAASGAGSATGLENSGVGKDGDIDDEVPELEAPEDDGPVDETGVDPKDIELVMAQVNCSRAKAVRVLKESGGDLINAIMAASE
ncbi:hypothetical protein EI94DRAFT_1793729 [Lactarius quietus]|nr:hypothetical protein EI94DRAFT_1793729 [Lactarius quietus]